MNTSDTTNSQAGLPHISSLAAIKAQLPNVWELNDDDYNNFMNQVEHYLLQLPAEEAIRTIREQIPLSTEDGIDTIYEIMLRKPAHWGTFFKDEVERAYKMAEKSDNENEILQAVGEFTVIDDPNELPYLADIIQTLTRYTSSKKPFIRFQAIWFLLDIIEPKDAYRYPAAINRIADCLKDENFKVRIMAHACLSELDKLPPGFRLSLADRIKKHFTQTFYWS